MLNFVIVSLFIFKSINILYFIVNMLLFMLVVIINIFIGFGFCGILDSFYLLFYNIVI